MTGVICVIMYNDIVHLDMVSLSSLKNNRRIYMFAAPEIFMASLVGVSALVSISIAVIVVGCAYIAIHLSVEEICRRYNQ